MIFFLFGRVYSNLESVPNALTVLFVFFFLFVSSAVLIRSKVLTFAGIGVYVPEAG